MKINEIEIIIEKVTREVLKSVRLPTTNVTISIALLRQIGEYPKAVIEGFSTKVNWVQTDAPTASALLVNSLSLSQLAAIANLQVIDPTTAAILQFLIKGKPVWVLASEVDRNKLKKQAKFALLKKYDAIKEETVQFGLDFEFSIDKIDQLIHKQKSKDSPFKRAKYLTQKDLIELTKETNSLVIPDGSRLTPLAEDYVQEMNIQIGGEADAAGKSDRKFMGNTQR